MIEFTLKSRWAKKYPRERILKRGSEKAAGWDLHKFLLKNVGYSICSCKVRLCGILFLYGDCHKDKFFSGKI